MFMARLRQGQQGQGKINARLKQMNHNHNHHYNSMGFDTFEINLVFIKMGKMLNSKQTSRKG